jgi:hypothetical protein
MRTSFELHQSRILGLRKKPDFFSGIRRGENNILSSLNELARIAE